MTHKIITDYDPPPIPIRKWDFNARRAGSDEGDPIGYGATEEEAIAALLELEADHEAVSTTDTLRALFTPFGSNQ